MKEKTKRKRPDTVLRNKSSEQRQAVKESWANPAIREKRIENIKKGLIGKPPTFGHLGHNHSLESRRKMSEAHKGIQAGSKHPNWRGGISPRVLVSCQYKNWRTSVFERDNFTCQMPKCGQRGGNLEAHHIYSWTKYPQVRYEISNGITLCENCHNTTKGKEDYFIWVLEFRLP